MKRLIAALLVTICSYSFAQSGVSPNLIGQQNLTGTTTYSGTGGGYSGGSTPGYNASTNTIYFGYTQAQVAYTYAFSQALKDSGMTITGYNYSWQYFNQDMNSGNLSAKVNFAGTNGTSLHSKSWTLGTTTDWTNVTGSEAFTSPGLLASNIANFSLSFNGKDNRYWAGYYGPMVRNPSLSLNYTFDACSTNPLSSPTCPGYAAAYLTQQCSANALYSPSCPGYAAANFTQQCSMNSMYDPNCPGYAVAYLNYQCSINPLYATTCQGYEQAYFDQQCRANTLYNRNCPGYDTAYQSQQCSLNPLYATTCTGYATAYLNQQCASNPLYSTSCSGYQVAYNTQQCTANPLYATDCPGYQTAYKSQQCTLNALYATDCPGYAAAYFTQQCTANPLYDKQCSGYDKAYALKYVVVTTPTVTTTQTTTTITPTTDTSGAVAVAVIADPIVNQTVTSTATSASPAQSATATVPLISTLTPVATIAVEQKTEEKKDATTSGVSSTTTTQTASVETKTDAKPTARQELQAKREAAAKSKAIEDGKNLAATVGKASDMESQKQVQNVIIAAMGYTPGFDTYNKMVVPDIIGYKPFTVYNNQKNVDNRKLGWGLYGPSDKLHNELVESQYKGN